MELQAVGSMTCIDNGKYHSVLMTAVYRDELRPNVWQRSTDDVGR